MVEGVVPISSNFRSAARVDGSELRELPAVRTVRGRQLPGKEGPRPGVR